MNINVSKITRRGIMVIAAAAALWPAGAGADTKSWIGGQTGNWDFGDNWSGDTVPVAGDDVNVSLNVSANTTITYNYTGPDITLNSLTLDTTGGLLTAHNTILVMTANHLFAHTESIGNSGASSIGAGTFNQSGGSNNPGTLTLAANGSDQGTYALSGSGFLTAGNVENIGLNGTATFNQDGGTNSVSSSNITLGVNAGSHGTYNLNTGSVTEGGSAYVGYSGTGTFNQVDGTHHVGGDLTIGNFTGSQGSYNLTGTGTLTVIGNEAVGQNGTGTFTQSASTNTMVNLVLGNGSGAVGTYTLTNGGTGSSILNVAGEEDVGLNGTATFNQDHATHSISHSLYVGKNTGSTGAFNLTQSGQLKVGTLAGARLDEYVGYQGTGTFVQNGSSTNTATGLYLGGPGGNGSYLMNGAQSILTIHGDEVVGDSGVGSFSQLDGNHGITGSLIVGNSAGVTGTFALATSVGEPTDFALFSAGSEIIGKSGTGTFTQTGAHSELDGLILGNDASGVGTYTLSQSGAIVLSGDEYVGLAGQGTFNHFAGTQTITGNLYVAGNAGSVGTYTLDQTAAAITLTGEEDIGVSGQGTFNHTSGTQTITGSLCVAKNTGSGGQYNLSGTGAIKTQGEEDVGLNGMGTFNHSAGTNLIFGSMYIGKNAGSVGVYNLSGTATLKYMTISTSSNSSSAELNESVGNDGSGTFNQTGGTNNPTQLQIGVGGGTGVYNLSGGDLRVEGLEQLGGSSGSGMFVQTGGTNTVVFDNVPFVISGSASSYTLTAGSFASEGNEEIGGAFTQTGGTNNTESTIHVTGSYAQSGGSIGGDADIEVDGGAFVQSAGTANINVLRVENNGIYTLNGGTLNMSTNNENVGAFGSTGTFNQTGGSNRTPSLNVGDAEFSAIGTYNLSGGLLSVSGDESIGSNLGSTFNQTGGLNVVGGNLLVAGNVGSGSFTIMNGTTTVAGSVSVNANVNGVGTLTIGAGGSLIATGPLTITNGQSYNATNVLNLSDGGLVKASVLDIGGNPAELNWTGGTIDITGNVDLNYANFGSSLTLGGTQKLIVEASETVGGTDVFTLTINSGGEDDAYGQFALNLNTTLNLNAGGKFNAGVFMQSGGTVNGNYDNQQTYIYQSGIFNGRMINEGNLSFTNTMTLANGLEQDGLDNSLDIFQGQTLTCNGQGLDNFGTIELEGGTLSGNGPVVNDFGGTLNAFGTINPAFTNLGLLTLKGTLRLNGGAVNNGLINGDGTIIGSITNAAGGVIQPTSFTEIEGEGQVITIKNPLAFTAFGGNNAGGTILLGAGLQLNISNAWTNDGLVTLQGTGALLGGNTITNTGTIQGVGTVGAKISNTTGSIRASGGELDLAGAGNTNAAGGQIQASTGNSVMVLTGLATNAGAIALSGGIFDNNNKVMTNTGSIEGNGILRTGGLTNASGGVILLSDAATSVFGAVTNAAGGNIKIVSNTTTFFGPVTNNGTIKVTSGVARFLGNGVSMTVGGAYTSDPSDNYFNGLAITATGTVTGGSGDRFFLTGGLDLTNAGTFNSSGALSAAAVTNSGSFTQTGTLSETGNFINSGTAVIGGTQNWSPGTTFTNSASATFASDTGSASSSPLTLNDTAGSVTFGSGQHLAALTIATGASATDSVSSPRNVIVTGSLSVAGSLNLTNNDLIVHNGNLSAMTAELASAHGIGNIWWTGAGITSSSAATSPGTTALGVELNNDGHGNSLMTTFDGQTVTSTDVLVKYTFVGDADLSGAINATDYALIDNGFNIGSTGWRNGDFNYDNAINGDDYTLIDNAFNTQGSTSFAATSAGPAEMIAADADQLASPAAVPEPTILGIICMAAPLLSRRRRRLT